MNPEYSRTPETRPAIPKEPCDAPRCPDCGTTLVAGGGCLFCPACGFSTC